jgi:hypothetical protein
LSRGKKCSGNVHEEEKKKKEARRRKEEKKKKAKYENEYHQHRQLND